MSRPRKDLGSGSDGVILAGMQRGENAETIAARLGNVVHPNTIRRRMRELRGKEPAPAAAAPAASATPEVEPSAPDLDGVDVAHVDSLIAKIEKAIAKAEANGNLGGMSSLVAKLVALLEHKRKAAPMPKPDPNENPDMIAAKERARQEFHRLIDHKLLANVRLS